MCRDMIASLVGVALALLPSLAASVDPAEAFAIHPRFEDAYAFTAGLAPVKENGRWGLIDRSGRFVVAPQFGALKTQSGRYWSAEQNGQWGVIDAQGREIVAFDYLAAGPPTPATDAADHEVVAVKDEAGWRYLTMDGQPLFDANAEQSSITEAGPYREGHAAVYGATGWGLIDLKGNFHSVPGATWLGGLSGGLALARFGDRRGFVDAAGRVVIKPRFANARHFADGLAAVFDGAAWGYINANGEQVIPYRYPQARDFADGLAPVQDADSDLWGYIDRGGTWVIKPRFDAAYGFRDGAALVNLNGERGFIDRSGAELIAPAFDNAWRAGDGLASVKSAGLWGFVRLPEVTANSTAQTEASGRGTTGSVPEEPGLTVIDNSIWNADVAEAQRGLAILGYDTGIVDGLMGERTAEAIRRFQAEAGLPVSGRITEALLPRLRRPRLTTNIGHRDRIQSFAFSPDGALVATQSGGGAMVGDPNAVLKIWDAKSGRLIRTMTDIVGESREEVGYEFFAFNKDHSLLASAGYLATPAITEVKTGRILRKLGLRKDSAGCSEVVFGGHNYLAAECIHYEDATPLFVAVWDINSGERLIEVEEEGEYTRIFGVFGDILATKGSSTVEFWDIPSGLLLKVLTQEKNHDVPIIRHCTGERLLAAEFVHSGLRIWDIQGDHLLHEFGGVADRGVARSSVAIDSACQLIAAVDKNNHASVWELESGNKKYSLIGAQDEDFESYELSFDSSGKFLFVKTGSHSFSSSDGVERRKCKGGCPKALIWSLETGKRYEVGDNFVAFSPAGTVLLARENETLRSPGEYSLVDLTTGEVLQELGEIWEPLFSPDGSMLAIRENAAVELLSVPAGERIHRLGQSRPELQMVGFADESRTVIACDPNSFSFWSLETGELVRYLPSGNGLDGFGGTPCAVSADGRFLASMMPAEFLKYRVSVYDTKKGRQVAELSAERNIAGLRFSSDGRFLEIYLRDTEQEWYEFARFEGSAWKAFAARRFVAVSPDLKIGVEQHGDRHLGTREIIRIVNIEKDRVISEIQYSGQPSLIEIGPQGKLVAGPGMENGELVWHLWSLRTGKRLKTLKRSTEEWEEGEFDSTGSRLAVGGENGIVIWNLETGQTTAIRRGSQKFGFSPQGRFLTVSNNALNIWDPDNGRLIKSVGGDVALGMPLFDMTGRLAVTESELGMLYVWDARDWKLLARMVVDQHQEWVTITPEGFYVASEHGAELLHVVNGLDVIPISATYNALYRPDLVREKLAGDPNGLVRAAAARLDLTRLIASDLAPSVRLLGFKNGDKVTGERVRLSAEISDRGGGIGRLEWRVNGVTLGVDSNFERGAGDADQPLSVSRELTLRPGENEIELLAYNAAGLIASDPVTMRLISEVAASDGQSRLYVLAVGINDYRDSALRLAYAVPDARAISAAFQNAGQGIYADIQTSALFDEEVTAPKLEQRFAELGERIRPEDVFVLFLAGHGMTLDGRYYFVPQDLRYTGETAIRANGIGQNQWQQWLSWIKARKSILLYDTCESGSLTGEAVANRGLEQDVAIEKLNRAIGRAVLSAASDTGPALEGYRGHGLFTYAVLDGISRGDTNRNALIEVTELASHIDAQVPELSQRHFGLRQIPRMRIVGSNFPLGRQIVVLESAME